jgi:hypothetical protein
MNDEKQMTNQQQSNVPRIILSVGFSLTTALFLMRFARSAYFNVDAVSS